MHYANLELTTFVAAYAYHIWTLKWFHDDTETLFTFVAHMHTSMFY